MKDMIKNYITVAVLALFLFFVPFAPVVQIRSYALTLFGSGHQKPANVPAPKVEVSPPQVNPMEALQAKICEVVALKNTLLKKREEMQKVRCEYEKEIEELKNEITQEQAINKVDDFSQAMKNKRIRNNLTLIQRHLAYINKITKLENSLSQGIEELLFLERKTRADIKIVRLLDNKDELVKKINGSLSNYANSSSRFVLDAKGLNFTPLKKIWQEIVPEQEQTPPKVVEPAPLPSKQSQESNIKNI